MKKLNLHFKIVILISLFLISSKNVYSQWTIAGDLPGLTGPRPQVSVVDGNTAIVIGGQTINATYKTTNGGTNWTALNTSTFNIFWAVCAKDANTIFAGDNGSSGKLNFYKSINGGLNWTIIDSITLTSTNIPGFRQIRFCNSIPSFGIAYAEANAGDTYIYKTRDGGNTWSRALLPLFPGYFISQGLNVIDSLFYGFGTVGSPPSIILTTDGGVTWNLRDVNLPSLGGDITRGLAFKDKFTGIAATSGSDQFISRTTNGGLNWVNIDLGNIIYSNIGPCSRWIEGTDICYLTATGTPGGQLNQVIKSTNGGLNWTSMTTAGIGTIYMDTKRIGANIFGYAISSVPGVFGGSQVLKLTDAIVGINQISELVPDGYNLSQNYPNPFNPTTNLEFGISKSGFVSLIVYNTLGEEVATLVNSNLNAGKYKYQLSTDNYQLTSGVYFYKLAIDGNIIDTKRMVLLK